MKKLNIFAIRSASRRVPIASISCISILVAAFFLGPQLLVEETFADESVERPSVEISIDALENSGTKNISSASADGSESNPFAFSFNLNRVSRTGENNHRGSTYFGTLGLKISAKCTGAIGCNNGYTLGVYSDTFNGNLVYEDSSLADANHISTIGTALHTTDIYGSGFTELNRYGWSSNWNSTTGVGDFYPMPTAEQDIAVVKKSSSALSSSTADDTNFYLGLAVNNTLMEGKYHGSIVFTVSGNLASDVLDYYKLKLDSSDVTPVPMPADPTNTNAFDAGAKSYTYNLNNIDGNGNKLGVPTHPLGYNFLGYNTVPTYVYKEETEDNIYIDKIYVKSTEGNFYDELESGSYLFKWTGTEWQKYNGSSYSNSDVTITVDQNSSKSVTIENTTYSQTLYAVWERPAFEAKLLEYGAVAQLKEEDGRAYFKIQDMSNTICDAVPAPKDTTAATTHTVKLLDVRDNSVYTVSKLLDKLCWMTDNLALGDAISSHNFSYENTNLAPTNKETYSLTLNQSLTPTINEFSPAETDKTPASYINWAGGYRTNKLLAYDEVFGTTTNYGNYYSSYQAAASYKNITGSANQSYTEYSICPKNWILPAGDNSTTSDFSRLISYYSSGVDYTAAPLNFALAGRVGNAVEITAKKWYSDADGNPVEQGTADAVEHKIYESTFTDQGTKGYYMTNRRAGTGSSNGVYGMTVTSSAAQIATISNSDGLSVRCRVSDMSSSAKVIENQENNNTENNTENNSTTNSAPSRTVNRFYAPTELSNGTEEKTDPLGEDTIDLAFSDDVLYVIRLIDALPAPAMVTMGHGEQIEKCRAAYEALTAEEKAMINSEYTNKYNAVLAAYYSLIDAENTGNNLIAAACTGAAVAVATMTIFIIVKKKKEDEEEEEDA